METTTEKTFDFKTIKTYEDACTKLGITPLTPEKFIGLPDAKGLFTFHRLCMINRAICNGWTGDYSNGNQKKWFPYFEMNEDGSGFGFSNTHCAYWSAYSSLGSRLAFETEDQAEYAGQQFESLYSELFTL